MDNQENKLSPEAELDALLAQFLEEPEGDTTDAPISMEDLDAQVDALLAEEAAAVPAPLDTSMLEHPLGDTSMMPKIGADEALDRTGLIRPEDAEMEEILRQIREATPDADIPPAEEAGEADAPFLDAETRDAFAEGETLKQVFEPGALPAETKEESTAEAEAAPIQEKATQEDPLVLKKKPKKENTYGFFGLPHIASTLIWLVIVVAIGAAIGNAIWLAAADVLAFGREDMQVTITITENDDMDTIADKLKDMGLIDYPALFKLYVQITEDVPAPGTYELNTLYDYHALVKKMQPVTGVRKTLTVMIPEGYSCQQIFHLLQEKNVCTIADLETAAMTAELGNYWFLEGIDRADKYCLEGFLFPDTYEFYEKDDAARVLKKLLNNFNRRFTDTMADKLTVLNITLSEMMKENGLSQEYIDSHQMTIREIVIIASMIEKETGDAAEVYKVSSVIYNRLTNPNKYPTLDLCSTLVYITGRTEITDEDKKIDSPYNTYLNPGLTPGAICNPGRTSINAALDPENTDYYFYALNPSTGDHHFSKTYAEHQKFLESLKNKEED